MVVVKVRETYDLCTVKNKMTVISIHTPKPDIIKRNFPGLLMQCRAYRPLKASVRVACASVQPLDPLGVGTSTGDVAPEDVFNPILYTAMSNFGMSQLEARICSLSTDTIGSLADVDGNTAAADVDSNTQMADEFPVYYGLLSDAHLWKHAAPQSGLVMDNLRPLVYERLYNVGDNCLDNAEQYAAPNSASDKSLRVVTSIRGNAKPLPMINCTSYSAVNDTKYTGQQYAGFKTASGANNIINSEIDVPWINCCVAGIIIPPSRLHQLFYRMVVEWDIEFSMIRPLSELMHYGDLATQGNVTHYQNYNYSATKEALTGTSDSILSSDTCMVSANVNVNKVM